MGWSVTVGGPFFNLPDLARGEDDEADPFVTQWVLTLISPHLDQLLPTHASSAIGRDSLNVWSETIWVKLSSVMPPL
jgi:hypothetical protein